MDETEGTEAQVEEKTEAPPAEPDKKDLYVEKIEDPSIQARINQLYGKTKFLERTNGELADLNKQLLDRLEKLENNLTSKETNDRIAVLKAASVKALEDGNYKAATEINIELARLTAASEKKPETPPAKTKEEINLSEHEVALYKGWLEARDADGNFLRPWAFENHPRHQEAIEMANGLLADPRLDALPEGERLTTVLKELDRLMVPKAKAKPAAATVLSGEDHRPNRKSGLTEEQKAAARAMGLTEERYAAAVMKYGRKKAS